MSAKASIFLLLVALSTCLSAQDGGVQAIIRALDSSTNQWICSELERDYPAFFENNYCPPQLDFNSLSSDHPELFPELPSNNELEQRISKALLLEDCNRFIHLKALGDLYFPVIDSALQEFNIPASYRYLPIALSGLNPYYSNHQKTGIWQLSKLQTLRYGIEVNDSVDYRYNLNYSSLCFSNYLKDLRSKLPFEEAVFAALHEGLGPVMARVKQSGGQVKGFLELSPKSTIDWMMGYKALSSYFIHLSTPNRRDAMMEILDGYGTVYPSQPADFEALGSVLQMPLSELRDLNQIYPGPYVPANHALVLPLESSARFTSLEDSVYQYREREKERLMALEKAEQKRIEELKKQEEIIHTVRSGEVLGLIAQRYSVSINDIRNWNNLKRDMIYVGQKLSIFGSPKKSTPRPEEPVKEPVTAVAESEVIYTVQSGDNLWLIAKKYPGVSAENIMEWNNIGADLKPGMKLKIKTVE